jgi:hypothetical protein
MPNSEHDELRTLLARYADEARRSQTARNNMIRTAHTAEFSVGEIAACSGLDTLTIKKILY